MDERGLLLCAVALVIAAVFLLFSIRSKDARGVFKPTGFPLAYMTVVLVLPLFYMGLTGERVGSMPLEVYSWPVIVVSLLHLGGYVSGVGVGSFFSDSDQVKTSPRFGSKRWFGAKGPKRYNNLAILWAGRAMLWTSATLLVLYIARTGTVFTSTYGEGQGMGFYTIVNSLFVTAEALLAPATACLFYGLTVLRKRLFSSPDGIVLLVTLLAHVLLMGNRGAAIPAILIWLWFTQSSSKPFPVRRLVVLGAGIILAFLWIANFRGQAEVDAGLGEDPFNQFLFNISSPIYVTYVLSNILDGIGGFYYGATYVAVIPELIPGIIGRSLGIVPTGRTAALEFREQVGFSENHGVGFAFPSEAYMNFGLAGVLVASFIVGIVFASGYAARNVAGPAGLVYPLILGGMPYALRSDFLGLVKGVIYSIIIVYLIFWVAQRSRRDMIDEKADMAFEDGGQGSGLPTDADDERLVGTEENSEHSALNSPSAGRAAAERA